MLRWAEEFPDIEVCGYVFENGLVVPMQNVAKNPGRFFIMDFDEQVRVIATHGIPVACWHSHPSGDPTPSQADIHHHAQAGLRMLIVAGGKVHDHGYPTGP